MQMRLLLLLIVVATAVATLSREQRDKWRRIVRRVNQANATWTVVFST